MKLVVNGAACVGDVPGLDGLPHGIELAFATSGEELRRELPGAEILLGWDFRGNELEECWAAADALKWINWCGAGVDAVLFPELVSSPVTLTNSRGIFDRAMAEYVLGTILFQAKEFGASLTDQQSRTWNYRMTEMVQGRRVLIVGVGSIGREIARLLKAVGMEVNGIGRRARTGDADFGAIHAITDVHLHLGDADWVIGILPGTAQTDDIYNGDFFAAMQPSARFINIGRGRSLDEDALCNALAAGTIAGAMLDVFKTEPLPDDSPLWSTPNLIVSSHMSGDYHGYYADLTRLFLSNLARYNSGEPMLNVVDKAAGFVPS